MDEQNLTNWFSKPGDSIRAIMNRKKLSVEQVGSELDGGISLLRSLLDGSREIDESVAHNLSSVVGATATFWISRQRNFEAAVGRVVNSVSENEVSDFIATIPSPQGKTPARMSEARRAAEIRKRLVYFSVCNLDMWRKRYGRLIENTSFRSSDAYVTNQDAVLLWLRRGELEADLIDTKPWQPGNLQDRLHAIKKLSLQKLPELFLPKLRKLLAEAGVALTVVKAPSGCRASGATQLVAPDKAMLLMSFRHRADDQFWFTLFHEIGHLLLHKAHTFVDSDLDSVDIWEDEANGFAKKCIIPEERTAEFEELPAEKTAVLRFSASLRMAPGLTVGQLQKRGRIGPEQLNFLKRRWTWEQIGAVTI
ncbi:MULTISPECIES: ImmA/IrrE family metallo-endopeptidase [unclassified Phyllobacterium]|uniref:ImmA/IrrE family metallo-endopeptidase n=1 Tax=unclassified Phyllobacterium TaxID=2638441 RepID=UPI0030130933